jgi:hypothetical protein
VGVDGARGKPRGLEDRLDLLALDGLVRVEKADGTASANDFFELHGATSIWAEMQPNIRPAARTMSTERISNNIRIAIHY